MVTSMLGCLQVIDEAKGPITKKDYELWQAPTGDSLFGAVVNFLGRPLTLPGLTDVLPPPHLDSIGEVLPLGMDRHKPLINQQVAMKNREQISECVLTGDCVTTQLHT